MEYKIIVNPTAGKGKAGKQVPYLKELLDRAGVSYELEYTTHEGHATELARRAVSGGWPAVAAMGGDGTANEIINGLAGSEVPLAVIPAGTGNDLARSLNLPRSLGEAVKLLAKPAVGRIDLGEDQGQYFACITGIGFPADVIHNVNLNKGFLSGPPAILWGIIRTLRDLAALPVSLELDGRVKTGLVQGIFILNTVYAGGGIMFSPHADPTDGLLDVLVMRDLSKPEVMALLPKVYRGTHLNHPKVDFYRVREVNVYCDAPVRKQFDGNVKGVTPIKARIAGKPLNVVLQQKD